LFPTCTVPKAIVLVLEVSDPGVTAVPDKATFRAAFDPLLVTAKVPLALPADLGANVTFQLAVCPGAMVAGRLIPDVVNPAPLAATWLMVTLAVPVLFSTTALLVLLPTCMLPKATLAGFAASWPVPVPVPDKETVVVSVWVSSWA
jgi:hypothetical protein